MGCMIGREEVECLERSNSLAYEGERRDCVVRCVAAVSEAGQVVA